MYGYRILVSSVSEGIGRRNGTAEACQRKLSEESSNSATRFAHCEFRSRLSYFTLLKYDSGIAQAIKKIPSRPKFSNFWLLKITNKREIRQIELTLVRVRGNRGADPL